jgi:hypothetical protein
VGDANEDTLKQQILQLSGVRFASLLSGPCGWTSSLARNFNLIPPSFPQDKRNFLRDPPPGSRNFDFNYDAMYPVAMATLQEDDRLRDMRFQLVPKQVTEEHFWRNYFYRVSLIRQSSELSAMAGKVGD